MPQLVKVGNRILLEGSQLKIGGDECCCGDGGSCPCEFIVSFSYDITYPRPPRTETVSVSNMPLTCTSFNTWSYPSYTLCADFSGLCPSAGTCFPGGFVSVPMQNCVDFIADGGVFAFSEAHAVLHLSANGWVLNTSCSNWYTLINDEGVCADCGDHGPGQWVYNGNPPGECPTFAPSNWEHASPFAMVNSYNIVVNPATPQPAAGNTKKASLDSLADLFAHARSRGLGNTLDEIAASLGMPHGPGCDCKSGPKRRAWLLEIQRRLSSSVLP